MTTRRWRSLYTSRAWRALRPIILERDGWLCQIQDPAVCIGTATHVDHIVPPDDAPDLRMDPANLRAACQPCNLKRGGRRGAARSAGRRRRVEANRYDEW